MLEIAAKRVDWTKCWLSDRNYFVVYIDAIIANQLKKTDFVSIKDLTSGSQIFAKRTDDPAAYPRFTANGISFKFLEMGEPEQNFKFSWITK